MAVIQVAVPAWRFCNCSQLTSGSRKLRSAHSSCRLFCSGVPVMSSLKLVWNIRTVCAPTPKLAACSHVFTGH